jgi:alginate O-acetyltransferase complex protein AlgI
MLLYWGQPTRERKLVVLLLASYLFYGYWDYRFCGLLLLSSVVDYVAARQIVATDLRGKRRLWLGSSIIVNLSVLGFFKYWDFFAGSLNRLCAMCGFSPVAPILQIVLPVGISFYTFQSMSYTIDIFRGKARPARSPLEFLAFVSLFPQLVAGPIVRWTEVDQQFERLPRRPDPRLLALGLNFFIVGLFKKLCIADWLLLPRVDPNSWIGASAIQFWPSFIGWTFWLYFDFSSYSDMAVGLGLMLGVRFPINFNSPFAARSLAEAWGRWHITLGRWMRDYLYIPLGGSRRGLGRMIVNILIVYFFVGLWHGANWNMVGWGLFMGVGIVVQVLARHVGFSLPGVTVNRLLFFFYWTCGGFFFRAADLRMTHEFWESATGGNGVWDDPSWLMIGVVFACFVQAWSMPNLWHWRWRYDRLEAVVLAAMFVLSASRCLVERPFFYFQF